MRAAIVASQDPRRAAPRLLPVLRARVVGVEGRELQLENYEDVRGRGSLGREYTVTYRAALEPNETHRRGRALGRRRRPAAAEVSIEESIHERFKINVGDTIRFDVLGRAIEARVTQRPPRRVGRQPRRRVHVRVPARACSRQAPHSFDRRSSAGPQDPAARGRLQADLVGGRAECVGDRRPRDPGQAIKSVVDNVTLAVTVVGSLVVFSGLLILVGAVAMTKFRRVYEAAIFKTLGATRRLIATVLVLEYGLLGALAGSDWRRRRHRASPGPSAGTRSTSRSGRCRLLTVGGVVVTAVLVVGRRGDRELGRAAAQAARDAPRRVGPTSGDCAAL